MIRRPPRSTHSFPTRRSSDLIIIGCPPGNKLKPRVLRVLDGQKQPCKESRSEEHTSELQSIMRISYAVFCLKKKIKEERTRSKRNITKERSKTACGN